MQITKRSNTARFRLCLLAVSFAACSERPLPPPFSLTGRACESCQPAPVAAVEREVSRIGIHRLNNTEYHNTVRALLGVDSSPASGFISDEKALGFDSIADAFGMTDAQLEQYVDAAESLVANAFADRDLRGPILSCDPGPGEEAECAERIIRSFGQRAYRRPLREDEVSRLAILATDVLALGDTFETAIAQVVVAMLSAPQFLYRIELDPAADAGASHPVSAYELASRMSYLFWSSMPDERLFELAQSGELLTSDGLRAEVDRLLAAEQSRAFLESFGGQWLGMRGLASHTVDRTIFPTFDEPLRAAMLRESYAYFDEFVHGGTAMDRFFIEDVNFVDGVLATLYDIPDVPSDTSVRMTWTADARRGFLGLAGFLTQTSLSHRTAPTLRGKWVLSNLLCVPIPTPPPNVPKLDQEAASASVPASDNVRARLAEHRKNPECAACHSTLDPIGLGLENFDAIGRYRSRYEDGTPVDASGVLPDGSTFDGVQELSERLAHDARFLDCVSEKLLTYALSRQLVGSDQRYLAELRAAWHQSDLSVASLLGLIVQSDLFRMRRGEAIVQ